MESYQLQRVPHSCWLASWWVECPDRLAWPQPHYSCIPARVDNRVDIWWAASCNCCASASMMWLQVMCCHCQPIGSILWRVALALKASTLQLTYGSTLIIAAILLHGPKARGGDGYQHGHLSMLIDDHISIPIQLSSDYLCDNCHGINAIVAIVCPTS